MLKISGRVKNTNLQNIGNSTSSVIIKLMYRIDIVSHTTVIITGAIIIKLSKSFLKMYLNSIDKNFS
jgi:hypothetical protein